MPRSDGLGDKVVLLQAADILTESCQGMTFPAFRNALSTYLFLLWTGVDTSIILEITLATRHVVSSKYR